MAAAKSSTSEGGQGVSWSASPWATAVAIKTPHPQHTPAACRLPPAARVCRTRTAFRDLNPHYDEFFEVGNLPAAAGQSQGQSAAGAAGAAGGGTAGQGAGAAGAGGAAGAAGAGQGARLGVEVWDKDLVTPDDVIGAAEWVFDPQRVSMSLRDSAHAAWVAVQGGLKRSPSVASLGGRLLWRPACLIPLLDSLLLLRRPCSCSSSMGGGGRSQGECPSSCSCSTPGGKAG